MVGIRLPSGTLEAAGWRGMGCARASGRVVVDDVAIAGVVVVVVVDTLKAGSPNLDGSYFVEVEMPAGW